MNLTFEWDKDKSLKNFKKHKISFEEGKTIFNDPFLLTFPDINHSSDEMRYVNIGQSASGKTLIVIHTERQETIRIISCRKAVSNERKAYEKQSF
ncbi:Putative toxin-antitoxin system, toxin component, type II BrnT [Desulfonema limicola]|uniref:Toxin-antitoxin system, toxin component, type II BrnT n=1 Tax=Desulfonema limicola TaxID=45656 RepID=A0A975BD01_9BACT|nr:BrnT family toxin [Desulfonema limicola]QTA83106.1 Putative toxin-antitoxin system, toxin component, type II BrnT [Desulfonema limicola]